MFDALCEVRNIYQKNVVEIGVDVEQREEVEIPIQMVKHWRYFCIFKFHGSRSPTPSAIDTDSTSKHQYIYKMIFSKGPKGLFKQSQHVGPTSSNIVECNTLVSFENCWITVVGRC